MTIQLLSNIIQRLSNIIQPLSNILFRFSWIYWYRIEFVVEFIQQLVEYLYEYIQIHTWILLTHSWIYWGPYLNIIQVHSWIYSTNIHINIQLCRINIRLLTIIFDTSWIFAPFEISTNVGQLLDGLLIGVEIGWFEDWGWCICCVGH